MTPRNLEIFVAVAECGKMSQAAKDLYITQSSVSQAISDIEKEYGVRLFERLSRSLYLTDTGKGFLVYAKKALALQADIDDFLHNASKTPKLRIGATVTVGTCVMGPIVNRLHNSMPSLRTEVTVDNTDMIEELILKSRIDIGLVEGRISSSDLICRKAMDDDMVMICGPSHPFFGLDSVSIEMLSGMPLILREQGSGTRAQIEHVMRSRRLEINAVWECCSAEAVINGVMYDDSALSILSKRLVSDKVKEGRLWACRITDADFSRTFDLVYHKDKLISKAMESFIDTCLSYEGLEI